MPDPGDERAAAAAISYQDFPAEWYALSDERHFWVQWRFRVWRKRAVERGIDLLHPARALDVGSGVGTFGRQVEAQSAWSVDGADLNPWAARHALPGRGRFLELDIFTFPPELLHAYDHVFLFDVLEHLPDPQGFAAAALRYLRPGGYLHINVPSYARLFSVYDEAAGHLRRYSRHMLLAEVSALGLVDTQAAYWGASLVPYLVLRKLWLGRGRAHAETVRSGFEPPGRLADLILRAQMSLETRLPPKLRVGTSCMLIAKKPES